MKPRSKSITAGIIAVARAIESCRPESARLFCDPFARHFLSRTSIRGLVGAARLLRTPDAAEWAMDRICGVPGLMKSFFCRTRCIDDALQEALSLGCKQVLILGAGYDSRAYRISGIERIKVFEVDHPATQQVKRMRLLGLVDKVPSHVVFVPIDFDREDLRSALDMAEFRFHEYTFVIWEGVTQYIRPEAVDATLNFVSSSCSPGSQIIFTYVHRGVIDSTEPFEGADKLIRRSQRVGEPWVFGIRPEELKIFLQGRGLTLLKDLGAARQYLESRGRMGPICEFTHIALAQVSDPEINR